jgi:AraC family transcriptional regulator
MAAAPRLDKDADPRCGRRRRVRLPGFVISEFFLPAGYESEEHAHAIAALVLPVAGSVRLTHCSSSRGLLPGEALTLPAGAAHREHAAAGVSCILVEPAPDAMVELPRLFDEISAVRDPEIERTVVRLVTWLEAGCRPEWELEYDAMELGLLVSGARAPWRDAPGPKPTWIPRVTDRLRAEFPSPPSGSELAREAGVSREHLLREFRRATGDTVGGFLRRQRVLEAVRMLRESDRPISRVATAAGFVDQSHLTRQLRRYLGVTPGMVRTRSALLAQGNPHL